MKLDVNGNCLWAKKSIGAGLYGASGLDIDDFGNIYICGTTSNSTIFDTDTISAGGFILKYNSSGNLIWAKNKFRSFNNYPYFTEVFYRSI
ncbi:MAG: SBBP repeat-containing protein [Bacteroidetes bacterium]|nr:SBBP repeat-containing protein [Bacteroidota bacterium]